MQKFDKCVHSSDNFNDIYQTKRNERTNTKPNRITYNYT